MLEYSRFLIGEKNQSNYEKNSCGFTINYQKKKIMRFVQGHKTISCKTNERLKLRQNRKQLENKQWSKTNASQLKNSNKYFKIHRSSVKSCFLRVFLH